MRLNVFILALASIFSFSGNIEAREMSGTTFAKIKITGTATGGEVSLVFSAEAYYAEEKSLTEVKVTTVAGDTAAEVARKLRAEFRSKAGDLAVELGKDDFLLIGGVEYGEVALKSTDGGVVATPAVENLASTETQDKGVKVTWTIPQNVTFDKILVINSQGVITKLAGDALEYTMTKEDIKIFGFKASTALRIVAVKNDAPSEPGRITVSIPAAP